MFSDGDEVIYSPSSQESYCLLFVAINANKHGFSVMNAHGDCWGMQDKQCPTPTVTGMLCR